MRLKDVARQAGVSTATVSHVINNTKHVTAVTREKVLRAIKQCNYYANAHARTLASGRSNIIGLLVSDISNPFFPELVKSIEDAAFGHDYNVILFNTNYDARRAADYVRRLIELKVAGVALMTTEFDVKLIDELARKQVPVVLHNVGTTGEHMSDIVVDYAAGIEEAVKHLVSLGHRNIVHIAGPTRFRSANLRRKAFLGSIARHLPRAPKPAIYEGDFKFESLAIPRDISIVGFDDITFAALAEPPLTTVHSPRIEIGRKAIEALMATIKRSRHSGEEVRVKTHLVLRGTTALPNKTQTRQSHGRKT